MATDDDDIPAVCNNIKKDQKYRARISLVLRAGNATPWVVGMFYKAAVQVILLFGSETCNLTPSAHGNKTRGFSCQCSMEDGEGAQTSPGPRDHR